ncbi:MAG: transposase [Acidobacteria bacterium]|nr:transposase [Acidobacteriota bacterium]MBU4306327.1 transposase [Acidobacteriota bacterium]MBU4405598.1 transposase [Acidobacteriota bacterium]MCG2810778.1 transposase [Candidatus Aminicenantes bacterium]
MPFDREKHHRRSIRLKGFNYTQGNAYFVTICSYQKECIFGNISDGLMVLNEQGKCIEKAWLETAAIRPSIKLDEFIIMPNHFHGIIWIVDEVQRRGTACRAPSLSCPLISPNAYSHFATNGHGTPCPYDTQINKMNPETLGTARCAPTPDLKCERFGRPVSGSLPTIIRSFKSAAGKYVNESRGSPGTPVWQRNYYEHIIRDNDELQKIMGYICCNPENWQSDEENPLT